MTRGSPFKVECKTDGLGTGMRLVRDLSEARFRRLSTWDYEGSTIWASKGCRGDFEITHRGSTPVPLPGPAPQTRVISCGNSTGATMSCNAYGTVASARLVRDLGGGRCRKGSTWNHDEGNIWVKQGC